MLKRSMGCGELRLAQAGQEVVLNGWVQRRRDLGGLIFIDLRDRSGLVQVVFSQELDASVLAIAEQLRSEYVVALRGTVTARDAKAINPNLPTGEVEVVASELQILNKAKTPPFYIQDGIDAAEDLRLKYRYLDLRRPEMQASLMLRHRMVKSVRDYYDAEGFVEVETPILTKSTPEGARDYLVPSRLSPGEFYALPQSPQLFKQLLMVSGLERYIQIAKCFRDEDLRADRQPEFTQIDVEMSFVDREDVIASTEQMVKKVFGEALGVEVSLPITRMTWADAMDRYGSDKPDLRFGMEFIDVSAQVATSGFGVFSGAVAAGGQVKAIRVPGCADYSRKQIDELTEYVKRYGAKGLAWLAVQAEVRSSFLKFLSSDELSALLATCGAAEGDLLLFVADQPSTVAAALGALRLEMGRRLGLMDPNEFKLLWVVDFPLLEFDEDENRFVAVHHPFTSPHPEDLAKFMDPATPAAELAGLRANAYDLVLNGVELGGGSIRIHQAEVQERMFSVLGFTQEQARSQFGFLLDAFAFGTPPHGGIALGLDRWAMLLAQRPSIRDVMAFPKTASATDLMTAAPAQVDPKQLDELGLKVKE